MAPRRRLAPRPRARRGVTLVVVAMSLMVFLGFAALAIDIARLTNFKAELKGIADAAAMSAALDLAAGRTLVTATANVTTLVANNPIERTATVTAGNTAVAPITWNFDSPPASGSEVVLTSGTWNTANAVRVIVSYSMSWTLAKIFRQGSTRTLVDTSIAAFGQRATHDCLRPIVFPYSALRSAIALSPTNDTTSLTAANVFGVSNLATSTTYTVLDTVNAANSTSFGWANTKQGSAGTAPDLVDALSSCASGTLGSGSTLQARPRFGDTVTVRNAAIALCGSSTNCTSGTKILVPIYTSGTNTAGTTTTTTTTTLAADQLDTLAVSEKCYNKLDTQTWSTAKTGKECKSYAPLVPTASTSAPVLFTSGSTTYSCTGGPGNTPGRFTSTSGGGKKKTTTYYLVFTYTPCYTTTTTTVGSARSAATYVIKYVGTFLWTARTNTTITGRFTTINYPPAGSGSWMEIPGLVTSVVLVR